jgi:Cytidylate kinase-like family
MIRVITIEREYGCGAAEIARRLSDRLGWKLWDQSLTQEIARLAHCRQSEVRQREERLDPLYYRLLKSFALGSYEGGPAALWRCSMLTVSSESPNTWFKKQRQPAIA